MNNGSEPARSVTRRELIFGFGGTIAPADMLAHFRRLPRLEIPRESFEVDNPLANVKHRADTPFQVKKVADRIGSSRYTHVAVNGTRTLFEKVGGVWQTEGTRLPKAVPAPLRGPEPDESMPAKQPTKTGEELARDAHLRQELTQRYITEPVQSMDEPPGLTDYSFRALPWTLAFQESPYHLATHTNLPSVTRSMIDVSQLRGWGDLRVTGDPQFTRQVWLEAAARDIRVTGYEPNPMDLANLKVEREARRTSHELEHPNDPTAAAQGAARSSARGSGGRKAVLVAIDAVLEAKHVPEARRSAVLDAAEHKLAQRARDGQALPKVKVYDKTAPPQRPAVVPTPEQQLTHERGSPAR